MLLTEKQKNIEKAPAYLLSLKRQDVFVFVVVAALTGLAFFMRRKGLATQSLWFDEADLVSRAKRDLGALLGDFFRPGENGPLYTLFMHFWLKLAGTGEAALRTPSLLAGTAVVPMIYLLGRRFLGGTAVGLVAAGLVAVSPYQLWYSQDAKMYPLAMLLTVASVYLFLMALEKGGRGCWIAYVVLTTLSFYVHLMSILIVAVEVAYFFLVRPYRNSSQLLGLNHLQSLRFKRRAWISLGLLTLPYLPIAIWQMVALWDGGLGKTWFRPVGLPDMLNTLGRRFGVNRIENPLLETSGALLYAALVIVGLFAVWAGQRIWNFEKGNWKLSFRFIRHTSDHAPTTRYEFQAIRPATTFVLKDRKVARMASVPTESAVATRRIAILLSLYLILPVLAFYLLTTRIPLFADRYLLIASPAYYLLAAWGLVWLARKLWPVALVGGVAALVFAGVALFSFNYADAPQKEDWREAMRWLQDELRPGDEVIVLPGYLSSAVDYYLKPGQIPIYTIPQSLINGSDDPALNSYLSAENGIIRNHERAWIITSPERYQSDDPNEYVRKTWFDNNTWTFHDPQVFVGVTIYGYTFKQIPGTNADYYPHNASYRTNLKFGSSLLLEGYDLQPTANQASPSGEVSYDAYLHLTLYWRKIAPDTTNYQIRVRLLDMDGNDTKTNYLAQPLNGYYPTGQWKEKEAVRDYRDLYIHLSPGQYQLEVSVFPVNQPQSALPVYGTQDGQIIEAATPVQKIRLTYPIKVVKGS